MTHSTHQEKAWVEPPLSSDRNTPAKHDTSTAPLRAALLQLPQQYFKAIVKPSVATYSQDKGNASWSLVWLQLLAWAILDAALGVLVNLFCTPANNSIFSCFLAI